MRTRSWAAKVVWTVVAVAVMIGALPQVAAAEPEPMSVPITATAKAGQPAKVARPAVKKVWRVPRPVRGGQATIDRGRAVLYYGPMPSAQAQGTTWIAGHNWAGWAYWSKIPRGAKVVVTGAKGCKVTYRVVARRYVDHQGGSAEGLVHHDLMLQTCRGDGTMFVYANRIR